ncbi:MAG TPA: cytochrome P450 [Steroidobacteraceae bacterium]|nr:cytochrome P450 [Steroidobacteraceae bacterium]
MEDEQARASAQAFDPNRLTAGFYENPYAIYAALRTFEPVHRCPDGSYFLSRFADLDEIYRDRTHFSSDKKAVFGPKFGPGSPLYAHHTTSLVFNDPPYHTRVRRQIVGALSPNALRALQPGVTALVDRLLEQLEERQRFDLIEDFAAAIPVEVIGNLLRVPREDRGPLRAWSLAILGALETELTAAQRSRGNDAVTEFTDYLRGLIADRRRHPLGEADLLSMLLQEAELTESELLQNCVFLLNAGHETTTNLIGNGLYLLLNHPESATRLREDPQLIGTAVEECLRLESPNQLGNRLVTQQVEIGGVTLEPNTYLTLCIGAANRDPDGFTDPERFDIARKPNRHLAFAAGAHACAGMGVARLEGQIALLRTVRRLPRLRLAAGATRAKRARFRGFLSLPAELS